MGVTDLSSPKTSRMPEFEWLSVVNHVQRKDCLLPGFRTFSHAYISPLHATIRWKPQDQIVQLPRSIPLYGFFSTDVQRKSPGCRSLSSCTTREALPHGGSWWRFTQYPRQCQQGTRLENLCLRQGC